MAGYQDFQDYRHPNENFTEDEDEVDEENLTEDESAEEDCAPYQVRHYTLRLFYSSLSIPKLNTNFNLNDI